MGRRVALAAALGVHLAVAIGHGTTHALVPVGLPPELDLLVLLTVFLGPVAGVALAWRGHSLGIPLFAASMTGGLLLGGYLHFVVENSDHVAAIPAGPWQVPFQATAAGVAVTQGTGLVVGAWFWLAR